MFHIVWKGYFFQSQLNSLDRMPIQIEGNEYTFRGDNSDKLVCLPSEDGSTLTGKNLLSIGDNSLKRDLSLPL